MKRSSAHKLSEAFIRSLIDRHGKVNLQDFVSVGMCTRTGTRYIKRFMADNPGVIEYDASLKAYRKAK